MCGRFAVTTDPALLARQIEAVDETARAAPAELDASPDPPAHPRPPVAGPPGDPPRSRPPDSRPPHWRPPDGRPPEWGAPNYNVAPTTTVATVVRRHSEPGDEATRRLRSMRWGFVAPWTKATADGAPARGGPLLINARADKLSTSPAFRAAAKSKRCLVPMAGWYEWKVDATGAKTPHYLHAADGEPLFMAGLWSAWRSGDGSAAAGPPLLSCTIVTTDAAGPLADIHDRMPLTVSAPDWDRWLDPDSPVDTGLLRGHGDLDRIAVRAVSTLVNRVANNGPELIEPADPQPEQATLL